MSSPASYLATTSSGSHLVNSFLVPSVGVHARDMIVIPRSWKYFETCALLEEMSFGKEQRTMEDSGES